MKFKSQLLTQASGSVGGATWSRNRGGMYIRARATPVNPGTVFQEKVRNAFSDLNIRWNQVLNEVQRAAWDLYALNVPLTDKLGDPVNIGGKGHYVRSNVPRVQIAESIIDVAPVDFNLAPPAAGLTVTATAAGTTLSIGFNSSEAWAGTVDAFLIVYQGRPQNPSINYFKGPYRLNGTIDGAAMAPASPQTVPKVFAVGAGQRVFMQARVALPDGRLSPVTRFNAIAT